MGERQLATAFEPADRFGQSIKRIVDGEKDWPASQSADPAELEAQRRRLAHELFDGVELVDLVGHSTPIRCCLKLGDWVLGPAEAERLATYLPGSVKVVRLIGCGTASTEEGRAAAAAFARHGRASYATLHKVYATHFDQGGVKRGIEGPPMRGFFPAGRPDPRSAPGRTPEAVRPGGLLARLRNGVWTALSRLYRRLARLVPARGAPRARIAGLLGSEGVPMPGLLTEPLLVFEIASRSGPWTLEILFDFECARFYPSAGSAAQRDLVYEIRGAGPAAKTPLEAYLERAPRGVTLLHCHEEARDRCGCGGPQPPPPPGIGGAHGWPWHRWVLGGAAGAGVALSIALLIGLLASRRIAAPSEPRAEPAPDARPADADTPAQDPPDAPPADAGATSRTSPDAPPADAGATSRTSPDAPPAVILPLPVAR